MRSGAAWFTPARSWSRLGPYVAVVVTAGTAAIVQSLLLSFHTPQPTVWLLFGALAIFAGGFTMKMGSVPATVSVTDTFFLSAAVLFGSGPATILVAIASGSASWRRHHSRRRVAFNIAAPAVSIWVGAHGFYVISHVQPLAQSGHPIHTVIVPLLCLTAIYFLVNTGLTATVVALDTGTSPLVVWRTHFQWLWLNFLAAASVAFCLILLMQQVSLAAAAMVIPLLIIFHATLRSSYGRLDDAERHLDRMDRLYLSTIETLAMAIDAKDDVTHNHVRRVQKYAVGLAQELGVGDETMLKALKAGALLHDTGKLAVPEHILNKPGKLTEAEFETMKLHVDVGADILSLVDFPYPVVPIVRCHHESWDGTGYPRGIAGEEIPIGARILSVVDCFDALTSDRPYRARMTTEDAFEILRARRGTMYDPRVVDTFIAIQPKIAPPAEVSPSHQEDVMQRMSRVKHQRPAESAPAESRPAAGAPLPDDVLAFVSLSRLASGECSVTDVLALGSTLLRHVVPGATAAWYLVDPSTDQLVVVHASGPAESSFRGLSVPIGSRLSGWVAAHRQPIVNSDPALDLGSRAALVPPLQSCLSVPLVSESLVGVLTLYASQPKAFSDDQGRLVQMIAPHVANAVSRAKRREAFAPDALAPAADTRSSAGPLRLVAHR